MTNRTKPPEIDRLIHEPARLTILAVLRGVEEADFLFLRDQAGLTKGNLSAHVSRLEDAGYVAVTKTYRDKIPRTLYRLTPLGEQAIQQYLSDMSGVLSRLES